MYMFRSLLNNKRSITLARAFSDRKLPSVIWTDKFISSGNKIGTKSELKEDNPGWKATKGDGKSIYDCENETWCKPKEGEKLARTYKKKKIYSDEHSAPKWVEINVEPEWIEANNRED